MKYDYAKGSRLSGPGKPKAKSVGPYLERSCGKHGGRLTPEDIVMGARPSDSLLHPFFEWDDGKAAEAYRVEQARHILRSVVIIRDDADKSDEPIRLLVNVLREGDDDRTYAVIADAMSDDALRQQILNKALTELNAWQRKYQTLTEFASVFESMETLEVA